MNDQRVRVPVRQWKALGVAEERRWAAGVDGTSVVQKLLLRQEHGNWEEASISLELRDTPAGKRWLVTSIYKDYCDPLAGSGDDDTGADPEDSRNC